MISRQGEKGPEWKYDLLPVYGIYLLNFSLPEFPSWRTDVVLANEQTGKTFGRIRLKQIYISFERFDLRYEECVTPLEKTIYVLKNMNLFDMSPLKERKRPTSAVCWTWRTWVPSPRRSVPSTTRT